MNWLAHLFLSPSGDPEFRLGNLLADFVKGPTRRGMSDRFLRGVRCHEAIDAFTDFHPIVQRSRARIAPQHGHFSGILIDVFYDHFLACNWPRFSPELAFDDFVNAVHALAPQHLSSLPEPARVAVLRIIADDRLRSYRRVAGIGAALARLSVYLSARLRRPVDLERAVAELVAHHQGLEADFLEFFPQLQLRVAEWQDDFATPSHPAY